MDDEIKGILGSSVNYKYRMHDPRAGRFFAVDPLKKKFPFYSPYQFNSNNPVFAIELEGLESSKLLNEYEKTLPEEERMSPVKKWISFRILDFAEGMINVGRLIQGKQILEAPMLQASPKENIESFQSTVTTTIDLMGVNEMARFGMGDFDNIATKSANGFTSLKNGTKLYDDVAKLTSNQLGILGEINVKLLYGGGKKTFDTPLGTRFVDILIKKVAYESKVGYKSANAFTKKQFAKDLYLLDNKMVDEVVWTFMRSPKTGKVGASKPLLELFKKAQEKGYKIRTEIIEITKEAAEQTLKTTTK